jgi:hypothetical protein
MTELRLPKAPSRIVHFEISHPFGPFDDQGIIVLWAKQLWERVPISEGSRQKVWEPIGWAWGWRTQYDGRIEEQSQAGQAESLTGCLRALENTLIDQFTPPPGETQRVVHLLLLCVIEYVTHFFNTDALVNEEDGSPATEIGATEDDDN